MAEFNSKAIVELQNTLSVKNIERLKNNLLKRKFRPHDHPYSEDFEKGIYYYYDSQLNDIVPTKFEDELKEILWQLTNNIKTEIDTSNSLLSNKEKIKYWQSVLNSFEYIKEENQSVFDLFSICYKPKETIEEYLSQKYQYNPISQFEGVSYFTLKPKYSNSDLKKIYDFITGELFLVMRFILLKTLSLFSLKMKLKIDLSLIVKHL